MDESSENTALINYFDNTEITENSLLENSKDSAMAEKEIIGCPSVVGEITKNPVKFINSEREEEKDKNTGTSSMFEKMIDFHPSTISEVVSNPVAFANDFDGVKMAEIFKIKESSGSPTAEREIIAGPSNVSEIIRNPAAFVNNYENGKTKAKQFELSKTEVSSMFESEIVASPSTASKAFKRPAFKQKATKESIKNAIARRSQVPIMVINALEKYQEAGGATLAEIKAYIGEKYKVHVDVLKSHINDYLKKNEEKGIFLKIRGANGADKYNIKKVIISKENACADKSM